MSVPLTQAAIRRLLRPQSVALIGGSWTDTVASGLSAIGYRGKVWRVNPNRASTSEGLESATLPKAEAKLSH